MPHKLRKPRAGFDGTFDRGVFADRFDACPPPGAGEARDQPVSLRQDRDKSKVDLDRLSCSLYCDESMLVNGLIALGSFKLMAPAAAATLFIPKADAYTWLKGLSVVDASEPLRHALIHAEPWSAQHPGITGHYYRKVAMWLYMLQEARDVDWNLFIDADVLVVRPIEAVVQYAQPHRFAAMVEHWHQSLWSVFRRETPLSHRQASLLFHERASPYRMKQTPYFNSGVMLMQPDQDLEAAVKDVLLASLLYPELSRDIRLPEQTLLNVATMVRKVPCHDLFGLCVPSYHDQERGWSPPVIRHYLGDPIHRRPSLLRERYPDLVDAGLRALGTSVEELKERGHWTDASSAQLVAPPLSAESQLVTEAALAEESLLASATSRSLRINLPSAFTA